MSEMNDPTKTTPFRRSDDAAATVRRAAFRALLEGEAVGREELAALTGLGTEAVGRALEDLAARGRVAIDAQGAVVASAGLSVVPSRHRLRLNGAEFHTWCAIDAIGIPAALGSDALAETACAHCGREMRVEIRGGRRRTPATWPGIPGPPPRT